MSPGRFLLALFGVNAWEYGTITTASGKSPARRHIIAGSVQFILWKAGEQGHKRDFWYPVGFGHEESFEVTHES